MAAVITVYAAAIIASIEAEAPMADMDAAYAEEFAASALPTLTVAQAALAAVVKVYPLLTAN